MKPFTKVYVVLIIVMISCSVISLLIPFFIPPFTGYSDGALFVEASGWSNEISSIFWIFVFGFVVSLVLLISVVFVKGGLDKQRKQQSG